MTDDQKHEPHIAIALEYDHDEDDAPRVTAKGERYLAAQILEEGKANDIPIQKNNELAQLLNNTPVDEPIPVAAYVAVAEILKYLYAHDHSKGGK